MTQKQVIVYVLLAVAAVGMLGWQVRERRFKKRVERQMAERGQTPGRQRLSGVQVMWMALALLFGIALLWLQPRVDAIVGSVWGKVITWGGLFVVIWVGLFVVMLSRRDGVVAQARALAKTGDDEGAIALLRKAIEQEPSAMRFGMLGMVLAKVQRYGEAEGAFARAEELEPGPEYAMHRALMLGKLGRVDEALGQIEAMRGKWPQEGALALVAGTVLAEAGREQEAREQLRQGEELLRAFAQRVDIFTSGALLKNLRERLGRSGERAFEVQAPGEKAP